MKLLFISLLLLFTSGCNQFNIQSSGPEEQDLDNVLELKQQADKAYQDENWPRAENIYRQLTEKVPAQVEPWFRLGNIYARTERLDAAVAAYRNALLRNSEIGKIWHNLGIVHLRQATNTFIDMLEHTRENDPLNDRARHVVNSVTQLMATGFGTADE